MRKTRLPAVHFKRRPICFLVRHALCFETPGHGYSKPTWDLRNKEEPREPYSNYHRVHLKHIIKVRKKYEFTEKDDDYEIPIQDILCHPYFMSKNFMVSFEDRMRTFNTVSENSKAINYVLEKHCGTIFDRNWTTASQSRCTITSSQWLRICGNENPTKAVLSSSGGLCKTFINHFEGAPLHSQEIIKSLPEENFDY